MGLDDANQIDSSTQMSCQSNKPSAAGQRLTDSDMKVVAQKSTHSEPEGTSKK
jgi:hypothetical protein